MKTIKVTDVYGREVVVNTENQTITDFNNKNNEITYNAQIVEDGKMTSFWTDYKVAGKVDDIELKLRASSNIVRPIYAALVEFDAKKNDPDGKIWSKVVEYVKENQGEFFTKNGDWKKRVVVDAKNQIIDIVGNI